MATEDERKLFVAGLPESITEDVLRQLFEATGGSVVDVSLPKDRTTGRPRGFGFVTFASASEAHAARSLLDGSVQGGRPITVRAFQAEASRRGESREGPPARGPGPDRDRGGTGGGGGDRTLYVGNLPYDCSQRQLEELFAQHRLGPVQRINLPMGPDGRMRGYGFVTMGTAEAAQAAIEALRTTDLRGRRLMVNVAHPRGDRPERGSPQSDLPPSRSREAPAAETRPFVPQSFPPPPDGSFGQEGDKAAEGRRRAAERTERGEKESKDKKKKKKGRGERLVETRRDRERHIDWDDWDDEG